MEEKGNLEGALELYRQALEVARGDPTLRSLVKEIELTIQDVQERARLVSPHPEVEVPGVMPALRHGRGEYRRKRLLAWALGGLVFLLLTLGSLRAVNQVRFTPTPATHAGTAKLAFTPTPVFPTFTPLLPTATPTPLSPSLIAETPISAQNAGQVVQLTRWDKSMVSQVAYSPDGHLLAVASSVGIYLYDTKTLTEVRFIEANAPVLSVAFSPDEAILASGLLDKTVRLWRVSDGALLRTLEGHTALVLSVAFSPDGQTLASGSWDNTVRLWRVSDGAPLRTLEGHTAEVTSVAFSPDGAILASGSADTTVRLWRVSDGTLLRTLKGHTASVLCVAFSPDGVVLASGSADTTIRLWRVSDGASLRTLEGHLGWVKSTAFSPDGSILASGSWDNTVRLWKASDGKHLNTLKGHTSWVLSVAFSPEGTTLASGSYDGTVRLWGVRP
jgi:WD40 repeat protein